MGYLPQAMVNYMALPGWNVGTENEFSLVSDALFLLAYPVVVLGLRIPLMSACSFTNSHNFVVGEILHITHVNQSGAIFDGTKLR